MNPVIKIQTTVNAVTIVNSWNKVREIRGLNKQPSCLNFLRHCLPFKKDLDVEKYISKNTSVNLMIMETLCKKKNLIVLFLQLFRKRKLTNI